MRQAIQRNAAFLGAMALAGAACVLAAPAYFNPRGENGPTILSAQSPMVAALASAAAMAAASLIAAALARMVNAAVGLFAAGVGMFVLAGRMVSVREFAFANADAAPRVALILVGLETILWSGLVLAAVTAVFRMSGGLKDVEVNEFGVHPHPLWSREAMTALGAGVLVLPAVWLIAQSPMKGQVVMAVVIGSMLVGLTGRLLSPHMQPVILFASPIAFGGIGHMVAAVMVKQPLDAAYVGQSLPRLAYAMPLDYVAGSLMGVAMGLGWARSFLHHEQREGAAAQGT